MGILLPSKLSLTSLFMKTTKFPPICAWKNSIHLVVDFGLNCEIFRNDFSSRFQNSKNKFFKQF